METTDQKVSLGRRHNPLTFYLRTLLYMFMALVMRLVTFLPLGALILFPEGSPWRWLAVLCPVLLIFFILPLRFSFADALAQPAVNRRFSFDKATSVRNYGRKLGESLLHALHIFLWGIPLWLMLGAGYYFYNQTDAITLMKGIGNLGAGVTTGWCAVANFFIGIFGGTVLLPNGGIMEGLYVILAILAVGLLVLLWGVVRNSAYRYIWARAIQLEKEPHAEARRRLHGRRWKQFWVAMLNLVLWVPTLFVLFTTLKDVLSGLSNAMFTFMATQQLSLPELSNAVLPLLFAFLVCYLPLLPVRRILTCVFATRPMHETAPIAAELPEAPVPETTTASNVPTPAVETFSFGPSEEADTAEDEPETPTPAPAPVYQPYHAEPTTVASVVTEPRAIPVAVEPEPIPVAAEPKPAPAAAEPEPVPAAVEPEPAHTAWTFAAPVAAEPEPAHKPWTFATPAAVEPAHPVAVDAEATYTEWTPTEAASADEEEPLAPEQEDVFAEPYQPEGTVAEDNDDAEALYEKPTAPKPDAEGTDH